MGNRRNPYFTLVVVWIVSSLGLTLVTLSPTVSMVLFFVLAVVGGVFYKAHRKDRGTRNLAESLVSDLWRFAAKIAGDFRTSFNQGATWYRQREDRIEREKAHESERQAQRRERLQELERKRRERPASEYLTPGEYETYKEIRRRNQLKAEQ